MEESGTAQSDRPGSRKNEPLYRQAARRLAREGEGVEAFLARNQEALGNSRFPGPDCLHPDELAQLRQTGRLPEDRAAHRAQCAACSAMLDATKPNPELWQAFQEERAKLRPSRKPSASAVPMWLRTYAVPAAAFVAIVTGAVTFQTTRITSRSRLVARAIPPVSTRSVLVTAHVSEQPLETGFVVLNTPPITVTAKPSEIATTVAATATVLSQPTELQFAGIAATGAASDPCRTQVVHFYSTMLAEYLKDSNSSDESSANAAKWLTEYRKGDQGRAGAPENVVFKGDSASTACTADGTSGGDVTYKVDAVVLKTLETYYAQANKQNLKVALNNGNPVQISLKTMTQPTVTVTVAEAPAAATQPATVKPPQ